MEKIKLLIISVFLICYSQIYGQQTLSGIVKDKATNDLLLGVTVQVKGTQKGTSTDFDGKFQLANIKSGDILIFSYLGYSKKEVTISNDFNITVLLEENLENLSEIVIIGYGTVRKEDLTGTVDLITDKDFNKGAIVSPQNLISGKIAGVSITTGSGAPGDGVNINIRGLGSLSLTSNPLIVVDGIPLNDGGVGGSRNPLNIINPNDIESMTVLKDASATSIYGSRAANGVIMITTKKGKNSTFKFNFNSYTTTYVPTDKVDVLNAKEYRELIHTYGTADDISRLGTSNTDWQDQIYQRAIGYEHSFSASGAIKGTPMRASVGYSNHDGILIGDNFSRITTSFNIQPSFLNDNLKVELNVRGAYTENTFADRGAIGSAVDFDPTQSVYEANSPFAGYFYWAQPTNPNLQASLVSTNPVALLNLIDDESEVRRFIGNTKVDYTLPFFKEITATINVGLDKSNSHGRKTVSEFIPTSDPTWDGSFSSYRNEQTNKLFDAYITYAKTFNNIHNLNIVAGHSYQSFEFDNYSFNSEAKAQGNTFEFIDKSKNVLLSYFGRLNYNYKEKYLLTATVRADASSKLNPDDRWGIFPSFALAWNLHKEEFLKESAFNELKLRVGYGEVGNVNGLGDYLFFVNYTGSQSTAQYQFGTQFYQTYRPSAYNENLKWEIGKTANVGVDFAFLNRRISGSVNAYIKQTNDLISNVTVDPFTNFSNRIDKNIGDMENRGIELDISVEPIKTEDLTWNINYNISFNDNEITNLPENVEVGGINGGTGNSIQLHSQGNSPFSFWVLKQIYDTNGKPIEGAFADKNGDNIINDEDRYLYKDPYADVIMGLNSSLSYKNWDFSIVTRANVGNYAYNNVASSKGILSRATENNFLFNIHSDFLRTGFKAFTEENLKSDHYVENASFFKIDNISVGYTFQNAIKNAVLRFYGNVQNVATFTKFKGLDPEITGGIDNSFYPRPQSFVLGLTLDF